MTQLPLSCGSVLSACLEPPYDSELSMQKLLCAAPLVIWRGGNSGKEAGGSLEQIPESFSLSKGKHRGHSDWQHRCSFKKRYYFLKNLNNKAGACSSCYYSWPAVSQLTEVHSVVLFSSLHCFNEKIFPCVVLTSWHAESGRSESLLCYFSVPAVLQRCSAVELCFSLLVLMCGK